MVKTFDCCRLCHNPILRTVIDLGDQALDGQFPQPNEPDPIRAPIIVQHCPECGLVQSKHSVDPALQFTNYYYASSTSATMRAHLKQLVEEAAAMMPNTTGARVLGIGSNDGYELDCIPFATGQRILIDPCDIRLVHEGIHKIRGFFPGDFLLTQTFDLILTIANFYDSDDPVGFAKAVKKILAPQGVWVVEVADQFLVMANNDYSYWAHEHVALYSPFSMTRVAQDAGLQIVRMEQNTCNGGSMRYYFTHQNNDTFRHHGQYLEWQSRISALWTHGRAINADYDAFDRFASAVRVSRDNAIDVVTRAIAKGDKVHLLGASTKLNVILQYCNLGRTLIEAASDRDPRKVGRVTPGTRIPIISEDESRRRGPGLYLTNLVMFRDELIKRERDAGNKAVICFMLPQPELVQM